MDSSSTIVVNPLSVVETAPRTGDVAELSASAPLNAQSVKRKQDGHPDPPKKRQLTYRQLALTSSTLKVSTSHIMVRPNVDSVRHLVDVIAQFYAESLPDRIEVEQFISDHRYAVWHNIVQHVRALACKARGVAPVGLADLLQIPVASAQIVSAFSHKEIHVSAQPVLLYTDDYVLPRLERQLEIVPHDGLEHTQFRNRWNIVTAELNKNHLVGFGTVTDNGSLLHTGTVIKNGANHVCTPMPLSASEEIIAGMLKFREFEQLEGSYLPHVVRNEFGLFAVLTTILCSLEHVDELRYVKELLIKVH